MGDLSWEVVTEMTAPTSSSRTCFGCGSTQILEIKAARGGQCVCLRKRGPWGFWWERSDGVQLFQRTRMLPDGRGASAPVTRSHLACRSRAGGGHAGGTAEKVT